MPDIPKKVLRCRRCGECCADLKALNAHVLAQHREDRAATMSAALKKYHADQKKIDRVLAATPPASTARARPMHAACAAREATVSPAPAPAGGNGHGAGPVCPTCGGSVPKKTADLVAALQAEGLNETTAFAAARIARRVFADPATAA